MNSPLTYISKLSLSSWLFALYLVLLPISTVVAGFITSASLISVLGVVYVGVSVFEMIKDDEMRIDRSLICIMLYFIYTLLSCVWFKSFTFDWYFQQFALTVAIVVTTAMRPVTEEKVWLYKTAIYLSIAVAVIAAVFNFPEKGHRLVITITSYMDPNDFACVLAILSSLFFDSILKKKRIILNVLLIGVVAFLIYCTGSRGGLLTLFVVALVFIMNIPGIEKQRILVILGAAIAAFLILAESGIDPKILGRFSISNIIKEGGAGRTLIWGAALKAFLSSDPLHVLFGYGHGSFGTAVKYVAIGHDDTYMSHNMFVNALIEGGITGLLLMFAGFISLFRHTIKVKNPLGMMALAGFLTEGISLDAQVYRTFAVAVVLAFLVKNGTVENMLYSSVSALNRRKDKCNLTTS